MEHGDSVRLLLLQRLRPSGSLRQLFSYIRMHVDSLLLKGSRVLYNAWLASEQRHAVGRCIHIISKTLFTEWTCTSRWQGIAGLDPMKISTNEIHGHSGRYRSCRLLVVAVASEPSGKVTKSRVSRRVVRLTYVSSVNPQEISSARLDSKAGGSRHTWQCLSGEHRSITRSHEGTCPFSERLRQSASSFFTPGIWEG